MPEFDRTAADNYLAALPQHVADRMGARLLRAALVELDRLTKELLLTRGMVERREHQERMATHRCANMEADRDRLAAEVRTWERRITELCGEYIAEVARLRGRVAELEAQTKELRQ